MILYSKQQFFSDVLKTLHLTFLMSYRIGLGIVLRVLALPFKGHWFDTPLLEPFG